MADLKNKNSIILGLSIVCLVLAGVLIYSQLSVPGTSELNEKDIVEGAVAFINKNLIGGDSEAELTGEIEEEGGVYKFELEIRGEKFFSYVTKDGKLLFPQGIDLEEEPIVQTSESEEPQSSDIAPEEPQSSDIAPEELTEFIGCLKKTDFVIYGANWCGWTEKLVEMLGGFDMVKPIYVECTEEEELCGEKEVEGYPTILIKGEQYQGARTFEDFVAATGCEAPSGAESPSGENPEDGGCQ